MSGPPLVTVITPAYNAATYLGRTIESVLAQTFHDWRMLIVDDRSSDDTVSLAQSYATRDPRIEVIALERNFGGPAGPRNVAINRANSKWIALLDADDIWHPRKLELQLQALERTGSVFSATSMQEFVDEGDIVFDDPDEPAMRNVSLADQRLRNRIPASSVIVERRVMQENRFREEISYKAVEDYDCWLRILETHGQCIKLLYPLLWYRIIEGQISGSKTYMAGRVFMVHRERENHNRLRAALYTVSHILGGVYMRMFKGKL